MNPYDDEPTSRHSRARSGDAAYDDYADAAEFGARASARASVGRASVGRASVPGASAPGASPPEPIDAYGPTYEPFGQGRDPYLSGPSGGNPYGDHPGGPGVPISPVGPGATGRAVVGRASVRPVSPSGPGPGGAGPGGRGPGGRGPGGRGPFGRWGRGPDEPDGPDGPDGPEGRPRRSGLPDPKAAKKARRRNLLVAGFAIFIMLTGIGVVGGTYYVDSVPEPSDLPLPETTKVYYADGKTEMAKLSADTRYELSFEEMNKAVKDTAVAAEDLTFWSNEGVDFKGVMRAAWNNFTGGQTQGASTITQQYARIAFDLQGATYSRKLREAVMAWKLDDSWSKEKILAAYLNTVPFGRKAHGIEAAAQAFFGKTARASAPPAQQITVAEAMVLMAMVKQPESDVNDPENLPGYDPRRSPKALELSKDRWNYIKGNMVALKYLTQGEADAMAYPMSKDGKEPAVIKYDPKKTATGLDRPTGLVVSHALSELVNTPESQFYGKKWDEIRNGGFKIVTTIDRRAQIAAEQAADITNPKAPEALRGQAKNWQAALVAVEPTFGRILAYYGGKDGAGSDYAGWFLDENGVPNGFGKHPPGSTFKVYDLATALKRGYSMTSYWDSKSPREFPEADRVKGKLGPIRNASSAGCVPNCTLIEATTASLNVPFFDLTLNLGPANVLEMARDAGVDYMWDNDNTRVDLRPIKDMAEVVPKNFSAELGIGQFAVTVMDHANGMATLAAGGLRADAHFVKAVYRNKDGKPVYSETIKQRGIGLNPQQIDDLNYTLSKVETGRFSDRWDSAGKTGTWQKGTSTSQNSDVWTVGYTKALAAAVWVGTKDGAALKTKGGSYRVFGATYAGPIWRQFMRDAHEAMKFDSSKYQFGGPKGTGDQMPGGAIPSPTPANPFDPCMIPGNPLCPPPGGGGPGGGGPGGGGPGGGGGGGGNGRPAVYETPPIILTRPPA